MSLLVILLLINEKQEENKDYNTITWNECDLQGDITIKNSSNKENVINIKYELKSRKGMEVVNSKKIKIAANDDEKINIYHICNIERKDVVYLYLSIEEYNFLLNMQPYILACFLVTSIFILALYFYIKLKIKRIRLK